MITKISVEPTIEPVSLAEMKEFLRLDAGDFASNVTTYQSITPGDHVVAASYTLVGTGVNVLGKRAIVNFDAGTCGTSGATSGTVDVKIQESDDNSTYTDWATGGFTQVTTANDDAIQEKEYTGTKQYIRVVSTVGTATCDFGVSVLVDSGIAQDVDTLSNFITSARQHFENVLNRAFITQTWTMFLDQFPEDNYIELPYAPLQSVSSILYTKSSDSSEYANTFSSSYYSANIEIEPGRIQLKYNQSWPTDSLAVDNPIKITFVAGYGAVTTSIPEIIRTWLRAMTAKLYDNRDILEIEKMPLGPLYNYRIYMTQ